MSIFTGLPFVCSDIVDDEDYSNFALILLLSERKTYNVLGVNYFLIQQYLMCLLKWHMICFPSDSKIEADISVPSTYCLFNDLIIVNLYIFRYFPLYSEMAIPIKGLKKRGGSW